MIMTVIILVLATLVLSAVLLAEISPDWLVVVLQIALGILIILLVPALIVIVAAVIANYGLLNVIYAALSLGALGWMVYRFRK